MPTERVKPLACPTCRYDLHGLPPGEDGRLMCPECGRSCTMTLARLAGAGQPIGLWQGAVLFLLILAGPVIAAVADDIVATILAFGALPFYTAIIGTAGRREGDPHPFLSALPAAIGFSVFIFLVWLTR